MRSSTDTTTKTHLPWSQRLILVAVALSPLQAAFTLTSLAELKASEIAIVCAIISFVFEKRNAGRSRFVEGAVLSALFVVVVCSALLTFIGDRPPAPAPGYTRSLDVDVLLYVGYTFLVLAAAAIAARTPVPKLCKAFGIATWICLAAAVMQFVLYSAGQINVLVALGFQTERIGLSFGIPVLRTGPFVEGQHLGVFAACALIIALSRRARLTALAAIVCIIYSQSTSAFIALALAILITTVLRSGVGQAVRTVAVLSLLFSLLLLIPSVLGWVQFQFAKLGFGDGSVANERSLSLRGEKAELAWRMTLDNPFFGLGPGRFGAWFSTYEASGEYEFPSAYFNGINRPIVENGYLQLSAESGLVALIALVIVLIVVARYAFRHSGWMLGLWVVVAVSFVTLSSWTFIPIWLVIGLLAALPADTGPLKGEADSADILEQGKALSK